MQHASNGAAWKCVFPICSIKLSNHIVGGNSPELLVKIACFVQIAMIILLFIFLIDIFVSLLIGYELYASMTSMVG